MKTILVLLMVIFAGTSCSLSRSAAPGAGSADSEAVPGASPRRPTPVSVEVRLDSDSYGFNEVIVVSITNVVDHDVALWGLCNLQIQGRRDDRWLPVWFVDCSRNRLATTWIAPGETIQLSTSTKAWAEAAHPDYDAFAVLHLGAYSEAFRLDSKLR